MPSDNLTAEPCAECTHPEAEHEPDPSRLGYFRCMEGRVAPDGGWEYYCGCRRRYPTLADWRAAIRKGPQPERADWV